MSIRAHLWLIWMTIKKARKVLGMHAENINDDQLLKELQIAEMLAEIVLNEYKKAKTAI